MKRELPMIHRYDAALDSRRSSHEEASVHLTLEAVHLLVVDDDEKIRTSLGYFLRKHGYHVITAQTGAEMRDVLRSSEIDLIILDIMLPEGGGLDLCRELRRSSAVPIILTAMGDETDRIIGLESGADDYLPKPFNPRELLARVKAVLRRAPVKPSNAAIGRAVKFANWRLDLVRRELVSAQGAITELTGGEYHLLLAFVEYPQQVLSRDQLLDSIRSRAVASFGRSIDVQVSRLRQKLETDPAGLPIIRTVRGAGYVFVPKVERL